MVGKYDRGQFSKIIGELDRRADPDSFEDADADGAQGRCWDCGTKQLLWVGADPEDNPTKATAIVMHELVHAAFGAAETLGFKDHFKCQEFHAYYIEWAVRNYLSWDTCHPRLPDPEIFELS